MSDKGKGRGKRSKKTNEDASPSKKSNLSESALLSILQKNNEELLKAVDKKIAVNLKRGAHYAKSSVDQIFITR